MPGGFDESGIAGVGAMADGDTLHVWWSVDGSVPAGTVFQVYINGVLRWEDIANHAELPLGDVPGGMLTIHVGRIGIGDRGSSFAAMLPPPAGSGNRARLGWIGGRWLSPGLMGFRVYRSAIAGGPVDRSRPVATLPPHVGDEWGDGFGRGPFGRGPFGRGIVAYRWVSGSLTTGTWTFAVASYDGAGRESATIPEIAVTVVGPPDPPKPINGKRLRIDAYDPATRSVTLGWTNA